MRGGAVQASGNVEGVALTQSHTTQLCPRFYLDLGRADPLGVGCMGPLKPELAAWVCQKLGG